MVLGVWCPAMTPTPLLDFLTGPIGIEPAYVRDRIETIFLDGMVVDDLERSVVVDGSTVTLSAAMPGLVGATLRRSGYYAAMRTEISWSHRCTAEATAAVAPALVRVKLFNLILREIGPSLLRRGVFVDRARAIEALGEAAVAAGATSHGRIRIVLDDTGAGAGSPP